MSHIIKEHLVPTLHRAVGEQYVDLTWGIEMTRICINNGGKYVPSIGLDEPISCIKDRQQVHIARIGVIRGPLFMSGNRTKENYRQQDITMTLD